MRAPRVWPALTALALILVVTGAWWALALWPVDTEAPQWLLRTREVCFGATSSGLPNAGGWLLLVGQPFGMLAVLAAVWPAELRSGLARLTAGVAGQLTAGLVAAAITVGLGGVAVRVVRANQDTFPVGGNPSGQPQLIRLNDAAPAMALVDQHGRAVTLEMFRGRPVVVSFAYAHCDTICPLIVTELLAAQARVADERPVILVVTLDPWRDTPSRLSSIAEGWRLGGDALVLSGEPDRVDRVLSTWRIPRARNEKTGELSHPSVVYVIGPDGRITYAVGAHADEIAAAVKAL